MPIPSLTEFVDCLARRGLKLLGSLVQLENNVFQIVSVVLPEES